MIVYVYMYYMFVRLSGRLNHIKGTIIIIIIIIRILIVVALVIGRHRPTLLLYLLTLPTDTAYAQENCKPITLAR